MIHWKCSEEKAGWRVHAALLMSDGVRIESAVVIPRELMQSDTLRSVIVHMQACTEYRRAEHLAQIGGNS